MGVKYVAIGSTRAKRSPSAESRASQPSQPYAGNARRRRARKYPRKSDAIVAAVRASPSIVRADGMSVRGRGALVNDNAEWDSFRRGACGFLVMLTFLFCGKYWQMEEFPAQR